MTHPTDDELEAMAVYLEFFQPGETSDQAADMLRACKGFNAALEARAEKAERGAAVTVRQAAKVLLDASGDWWPSQEAKQAAIGAYTLKNGKCRPVALTDAWHAALNALNRGDDT